MNTTAPRRGLAVVAGLSAVLAAVLLPVSPATAQVAADTEAPVVSELDIRGFDPLTEGPDGPVLDLREHGGGVYVGYLVTDATGIDWPPGAYYEHDATGVIAYDDLNPVPRCAKGWRLRSCTVVRVIPFSRDVPSGRWTLKTNVGRDVLGNHAVPELTGAPLTLTTITRPTATPTPSPSATPSPTATPSPSATPSPTLSAPVPTTVVADARQLTYGGSARLTVRGAPGALVDLRSRTLPGTTWRTLRTATLDAAGRAEWSLQPGATTHFSAQVRGGSTSSEVVVQVARAVTLGVRQSAGTYRFSGVVARPVAGLQVTLAKVLSSGRVVGVGSTRTDAAGAYALSARLAPGTNLYYVLTGGTADLLPGRSRAYGLAVR